MTIQDLAGNLFQTAESPMIGFVDAQPAVARALNLQMYRFLIEGIREADQLDGNRFIERFLQGPQGLWAEIDQSIRSLPDMWSIVRCPDRFLPYLKWIVGWTSELDYITDELDVATLRRLIATSVPFWKIRGTEDALAEILQLTTAARTRVLDWFDLRYIADETSVGEHREGHDSWVLSLPGEPDHSERQINVRIVDEGALNRRLVRNLCKLTRPAGERITISYLGFLDLFTVDDDVSQWANSLGYVSPVVEDGVMLIGPTNRIAANPIGADSWRNYVVSVVFKGATLALEVYRASDNDSYLIYYQLGAVTIYVVSGGVPTPIAIGVTYAPDYPVLPDLVGPGAWLPIDADLVHTLRVQLSEESGGGTRITVWLSGVFLLTTVDSTFTQGAIGFRGLPVAVEVREVEMFFVPLEEDLIDIQGV